MCIKRGSLSRIMKIVGAMWKVKHLSMAMSEHHGYKYRRQSCHISISCPGGQSHLCCLPKLVPTALPIWSRRQPRHGRQWYRYVRDNLQGHLHGCLIDDPLKGATSRAMDASVSTQNFLLYFSGISLHLSSPLVDLICDTRVTWANPLAI